MKMASSAPAAAVSARARATTPSTSDTVARPVSVLPSRSTASPLRMTRNATAPRTNPTADMPRGSLMNGISPLIK